MKNMMQEQFQNWNSQPFGRWKSQQGSLYNEVAIYTLQTLETSYKIAAADDITRHGRASEEIDRLQRQDSPLDRLNRVLAQSNLKVRLKIGAELMVERENATYSVAKMSDGERASLLLAAEVMSAPAGSIFIIDEPEPHLHEAIVVPLISSLFNRRSDCSFIVATHRLQLIKEIESDVLLVRDSVWTGNSIAYWDVDLLISQSELPEEIVAQIIGSRRKILFVEGTHDSLDQPLYALLFPNVSVISREGCGEVLRAVYGIRTSMQHHRVEAFGLVDGDGLSDERVEQLAQANIFALPLYSVESVYYSKLIRDAICARQAETFSLEADALRAQAEAAGLSALRHGAVQQNLAAHACYIRMRDTLTSKAPSKKMIAEGDAIFKVELESFYPATLQRLCDLLDNNDIDGLIAGYPIRESNALKSMAEAMRFRSRSDYEAAVLALLAGDDVLREHVLRSFKPLRSTLC